MQLNAFKFYSPTDLSEAIKLLSKLERVKIKAGGTFLINNLKNLKRRGLKTPDALISLQNIKELRGINFDFDTLTIGTMTTLSEISTSIVLDDNFKVLKQVATSIGTTPIRNMATIGGNLTSRYTWTEMPAVMIALSANLHFVGSDNKEDIIPADKFLKGSAKTNKILTKISIKREKNDIALYQRVKRTSANDIPILSLCVKAKKQDDQFIDIIVAVNDGTTFAYRDSIAEKFLESSIASSEVVSPDEALICQHLKGNKKIDAYKNHMLRISLKAMLTELIKRKEI